MSVTNFTIYEPLTANTYSMLAASNTGSYKQHATGRLIGTTSDVNAQVAVTLYTGNTSPKHTLTHFLQIPYNWKQVTGDYEAAAAVVSIMV